MNLLDQILLGTRQQNKAIRDFFSKDAVNASGKIEQMGSPHVITSKRSATPADIGMATALYATTGQLPDDTARQIDQYIPLQSQDVYQKLVDHGVKQGDSIAELYEKMGGKRVAGKNVHGNAPLAAMFAAMSGGTASQYAETRGVTAARTASQREPATQRGEATRSSTNRRPARANAEDTLTNPLLQFPAGSTARDNLPLLLRSLIDNPNARGK